MLYLGRQLYFRSADKLSLLGLIRLRMCRTAGLLIGKCADYPVRMLRDKPFNTVFCQPQRRTNDYTAFARHLHSKRLAL